VGDGVDVWREGVGWECHCGRGGVELGWIHLCGRALDDCLPRLFGL